MVAASVGGIQDQIVDGRDGLLVDDPEDEGAALARSPGCSLIRSWPTPGGRAHDRVLDDFLGDRHLEQYVDLFAGLVAVGRESS